MLSDEQVLFEFLGKELYEEFQNQIHASAGDDHNFLLEIKHSIVKDIKSIELL
jgi:hypothetical protein